MTNFEVLRHLLDYVVLDPPEVGIDGGELIVDDLSIGRVGVELGGGYVVKVGGEELCRWGDFRGAAIFVVQECARRRAAQEYDCLLEDCYGNNKARNAVSSECSCGDRLW